MTSYAYYRLPYANSYTKVESEREPLILSSIESIGGQEGFVVAPFKATDECPMALILPDKISVQEYDAKADAESADNEAVTKASEEYQSVFETFHKEVANEHFHKLVLARKKDTKTTYNDLEKLYEKACRMYPRLMIMLFSTPQTGTWIVASPEILIEGKAGQMHTVALAGTMAYRDGYLDWSEKNKGEQHIVEQYIANTLEPLCDDVLKDGPVTMRAGDLVHLRTDFRFRMKSGISLGALVSRMHPTPAVCGLPKKEAYDFILKNERLDRKYYSGFAGPVNINDETHLYVSLRCAELFPTPNTQHPSPHQAILYAGGGIMPGSQCEAEWQETESKMKTIAHVLQ